MEAFKFLYDSIFKSWKTTLAGVVGAVMIYAAQHGFESSPEQQNAILVVIIMVIGWLSKDANASHQD